MEGDEGEESFVHVQTNEEASISLDYIYDIQEEHEGSHFHASPVSSSSKIIAKDEEDALNKFNKEMYALIEERRHAEIENNKKIQQQAKEDRDIMDVQRNTRVCGKKEANRSEEQVLLEGLESESEVLPVWERVAKMVTLSSADSDPTGSDISRMRQLIIQLKTEPLDKTKVVVG